MAREKLNLWEELEKAIEEGRIEIPGHREDARRYFEAGEDIPAGRPVYTRSDGKAYSTRPRSSPPLPKIPTILEARAGEDGIFRVEGEVNLGEEEDRIFRDMFKF